MPTPPSILRPYPCHRRRPSSERRRWWAPGGGGGGEAEEGTFAPALSKIGGGELLTPEPANAAAVALSAALAWADASLLLQLALISFAIFATYRQVLLRRRAPPLRPHRSPVTVTVSGH